jgi:nucleoside-diphosphate-sugar epimerase
MILITGGAGVMGSRLVKGLVAKNHKVRVLTLPGDKAKPLEGVPCEIVYGDVADASTLKGVFDGVKTVYHLAAIIIAYDPADLLRINVEGTLHVVNGALAAGVEHFIYISSASATWPEGSDYAESKLAAEKIVQAQSRMQWTIVRPTLTYDGQGGGQEFAMFMESLLKYPVVPFIGRGHAKKNPVHADDIAKGLLAIADNPKTYGKTYNFSGGEEISIRDLAQLMLKSRGVSKPFVYLPVPLCRLLAFIMERTMKRPPLTNYAISRILHEAALDCSEARRDLGYSPAGVSAKLPL